VDLPAVGVYAVCVSAKAANADAASPTCRYTPVLRTGSLQVSVSPSVSLPNWQLRSSALGTPPLGCQGASGVSIALPDGAGVASVSATVEGTDQYGVIQRTNVTQDLLGKGITGPIETSVCLNSSSSG
jgi:hypothetical protein